MRNKSLKPSFMMSGKIKHRISSKAGTYRSQTIIVHIRFFRYFINGPQIILHSQTTPVLADGFIPLHAMSWHAPPIGSYYNISLGSHQLKIPSEGIELG